MISIIIVSYNTKQLLIECLQSIMDARIQVKYEIIVVDNNSNDDSIAAVKSQFPFVSIIENKENLMFSIANNQGIKLAAGDCYLLLNSDTLIYSSVIERLYDFIQKNPNVAAVGPRLVNADGSLQSQGYPLMPLYWTIVKNFHLDSILPISLRVHFFPWTNINACDPMKVGWISGACILITKHAVQKIGGLNEDLYFYGEEVLWCWNAKRAGMEVWCLPSLRVLHYGGGSSSTKTNNVETEIRKSKRMASTLTLVRETTGIPYNLLLSSIIVISCIIKYPVCLYSRNRLLCNTNTLMNEIKFIIFKIKNI